MASFGEVVWGEGQREHQATPSRLIQGVFEVDVDEDNFTGICTAGDFQGSSCASYDSAFPFPRFTSLDTTG